MGSVFSRPAAPAVLPTLTIRNLTVTPLELKLVEQLKPGHHRHKSNGLVKTSSRSSNPQQSHEQDAPLPSTGPTPVGVSIGPFSECRTVVYAPDAAHREQIRLTFEDTSTGHQYSADIPGASRRSIVLKAHEPATGAGETKEFTAVYLPEHTYLALFSSADLSSWMAALDPALPLSALSIPGTHNSAACHVALPSVRCQAVSVLDQLNNGVRFLDVRVSCPPCPDSGTAPAPPAPQDGGEGGEGQGSSSSSSSSSSTKVPELALVHSVFPVALLGHKYFSGLLKTVYEFLDAHPTETVLISLKREGTGKGSDADLARILHKHYVRPHRDRWYVGPRVPTLAQCRGRVVLVRRFGLARSSVPASEAGIDGSAWPDNAADATCGSGTIRIQDYYGVQNGSEIPKKLQYAQEGLARAAAQAQAVITAACSASSPATATAAAAATTTTTTTTTQKKKLPPPPPLFINFLSASNFFNISCWPEKVAFKLNPSMIEYLCMKHGATEKDSGGFGGGDAATGIVVTDWVGHRGDWDLLRCIVGWNARLQLRQ
ncbi:hypothetical protein VTH82DRAFT_3753 [Thermothelomyces myriococcoides]